MKKTMMKKFILILRILGMYSSKTVFVTSTPKNIKTKKISNSTPVSKNKNII
jgi:hypothetical protein